jgi:hypothetical protein
LDASSAGTFESGIATNPVVAAVSGFGTVAIAGAVYNSAANTITFSLGGAGVVAAGQLLTVSVIVSTMPAIKQLRNEVKKFETDPKDKELGQLMRVKYSRDDDVDDDDNGVNEYRRHYSDLNTPEFHNLLKKRRFPINGVMNVVKQTKAEPMVPRTYGGDNPSIADDAF